MSFLSFLESKILMSRLSQFIFSSTSSLVIFSVQCVMLKHSVSDQHIVCTAELYQRFTSLILFSKTKFSTGDNTHGETSLLKFKTASKDTSLDF